MFIWQWQPKSEKEGRWHAAKDHRLESNPGLGLLQQCLSLCTWCACSTRVNIFIFITKKSTFTYSCDKGVCWNTQSGKISLPVAWGIIKAGSLLPVGGEIWAWNSNFYTAASCRRERGWLNPENITRVTCDCSNIWSKPAVKAKSIMSSNIRVSVLWHTQKVNQKNSALKCIQGYCVLLFA